jgi:hypothetical protein
VSHQPHVPVTDVVVTILGGPQADCDSRVHNVLSITRGGLKVSSQRDYKTKVRLVCIRASFLKTMRVAQCHVVPQEVLFVVQASGHRV